MQDLEGLRQPRDAVARFARADTEHLELFGHRAPADAELESPTRQMVERGDLTGEDGRVPERVAQHEVSHTKRLGPGEHPTGDRHRLPHVVLERERWSQMVHEGDAFEPDGFGDERTIDGRVGRHSHLG